METRLCVGHSPFFKMGLPRDEKEQIAVIEEMIRELDSFLFDSEPESCIETGSNIDSFWKFTRPKTIAQSKWTLVNLYTFVLIYQRNNRHLNVKLGKSFNASFYIYIHHSI
jgi:hypothetical protein